MNVALIVVATVVYTEKRMHWNSLYLHIVCTR